MSTWDTNMLLDVQNLVAGHGDAIALHGVSLSIAEGQNLAILGRNGAGKTTLLETLMGLTRVFSGEVFFDGQRITRLSPVQRAHCGLGWVPQERHPFGSLTVEQNLTVVQRKGPWTLPSIYRLFPRLHERRQNLGSQLSGGEQQMLAIGRALMINPRLLLLDEPMEGLAPIIVEELTEAVGRMTRESGLTCIVVEQHPIVALAMTQQAIILDQGRIVHTQLSHALAKDAATLERFIGVGQVE